jgi:hypothetical protein
MYRPEEEDDQCGWWAEKSIDFFLINNEMFFLEKITEERILV